MNTEFGRLPISSRMRPKYLAAIDVVLNFIDGEKISKDLLLESTSQIKGMFNRCRKKDQWDWYEVWKALNKPSNKEMDRILTYIVQFRKAIKDEEEKYTQSLLADLNRLNFKYILKTAKKKIIESKIEPDGFKSYTRKNKKAESTDSSIVSIYPLSKQTIASGEHDRILNILSQILSANGIELKESKHIDGFCETIDGNVGIFEVKSTNDKNELSQIRSAVSQLYEYRYLYKLAEASLWIVLSKSPDLDWVTDYLLHDRKINVLWIDKGKLAGPSIKQLKDSFKCPNQT